MTSEIKNLFESWRNYLTEVEDYVNIPEEYRGCIFYHHSRKKFYAFHPDGDQIVDANDEPVTDGWGNSDWSSEISPVLKEDIAFRKSLVGLSNFEGWLSDYEINYPLSYITEEIIKFPTSLKNLTAKKRYLSSYYNQGSLGLSKHLSITLNSSRTPAVHPTSLLIDKGNNPNTWSTNSNYRISFRVFEGTAHKSHKINFIFSTETTPQWEIENVKENNKKELEWSKIAYLLCQYYGFFDI